MPHVDLSGKVIVITGASSGIGAATAIACARAGMNVVLGARRAEKLEAVVRTIQDAGGKAIAVPSDVCSPDDCQRLVETALSTFGSLYSVYANAGYGAECAVDRMSDQAVRAMFETNFFGTLNTIRAALGVLQKNRPAAGSPYRGHVLICSSCVSKLPLPYYSVYSATKAAQNHIGRAMNLELAGQGIAVSTVHPIGTKTEFFDVVARANHSGELTFRHTPESMLQTPEFVARKTLACLRSPRPEVWPGARGVGIRAAMCLLNLWPGLADYALNRVLMREPREEKLKSAKLQSSK